MKTRHSLFVAVFFIVLDTCLFLRFFFYLFFFLLEATQQVCPSPLSDKVTNAIHNYVPSTYFLIFFCDLHACWLCGWAHCFHQCLFRGIALFFFYDFLRFSFNALLAPSVFLCCRFILSNVCKIALFWKRLHNFCCLLVSSFTIRFQVNSPHS